MDTCSKILPDKKDPNTHHDNTHSVQSHSEYHWTQPRDSGVYVHMELNFDDSLPSTELEKTNDHKENNESDSPNINPRPEVENNNGEVAEKDQDVNYIVMSDPDLVICTAGGLKGSTSAVIPEVDNRKALMPPSPSALPPPLPPKRHQRSPASEKTLSQGPQLKAFNKENKPLNSLACQTSPILGGVKGNNQCLDLVPGEVPDMHNSSICGILPKVEPKFQAQFSPRPPPKSPIKPPRPNNPKRAKETEEGKQRRKQEAECRKHKEKMGHKRNRQEQDLTERNEKAEENEETTRIESHLDMGKPPRQILVLFTDKEKGGEEGEDRGKEDEDPSNTTPSMTENSSLLVMACSDLTPDEEPDMAATNRNCTSTVSAKPEPMIPPQPPPKPHQKCPPKLPIKPLQLFSAMRAGIEVEKERRKQEDEQWRDKDLVDKERGEKEGEGKDRGMVNGDTELTTPTMTEMPSQIGEIVMKSIPKSSVKEDAQEIAETLPDGELKQTNQKTNARGMVKQLAKKVMGRLKEGREEKRRIKAVEMKMDGVREDDIELTQDERRHGEEGGMKDEEDEKGEGMDEVAVDQSAVTETQSHVDLLERRIKRRNATSESLFSSFKVCSPVKLVEELLSGDEWSQFLYREQSSTPDPPPHLTHSEDTGQLSVDQFNCSAELDLALDVFEGNPAVPEEPVYEDIDLSNIMTEEQEMNRASITAIPKILVESETNQMSPRTKDIYDTVEFIAPVQPANTYANFSDIKSQGVLGSAVQKYLIKLSKKRKHRAARKRRRDSSHETFGQSPSSTSPQQVYTASIFYNVPASGGDEQQQLSTVKCGGSSPRSLAKIKMPLKDKTMLRAAQPKDSQCI